MSAAERLTRIVKAGDVGLERDPLLFVGRADLAERGTEGVEPSLEKREIGVACIFDRLMLAEAGRAAGISKNEYEIVVLEAADIEREKLFGFERNIIWRILGRRTVRSGVCSEEREIAGVACPLEVVRVTAEDADVAGRRVNDANVLDLHHLAKLQDQRLLPFIDDEVVARVGQVPRTSTSIGFSFMNPFVRF